MNQDAATVAKASATRRVRSRPWASWASDSSRATATTAVTAATSTTVRMVARPSSSWAAPGADLIGEVPTMRHSMLHDEAEAERVPAEDRRGDRVHAHDIAHGPAPPARRRRTPAPGAAGPRRGRTRTEAPSAPCSPRLASRWARTFARVRRRRQRPAEPGARHGPPDGRNLLFTPSRNAGLRPCG